MKPPRVWVMDTGAGGGEPPLFWEPGERPDSVGPGGLADLLLEYRAFIRTHRSQRGRSLDFFGAISDDGLRRLVLLAYRTSFLTDEGRPVRGRVVVRHDYTGPEPELLAEDNPLGVGLTAWQRYITTMFGRVEDLKLHNLRLAEPINIDRPEVLAKLLTVAVDDGGVTVTERDGELAASGLAALEAEDWEWELFELPRNGQPSAGLVIELLAPGHLRVKEGLAEFNLSADRLVTHTWIGGSKPVSEWQSELSERLVAAYRKEHGDSADSHLFDTFDWHRERGYSLPHTDITVAYSRMLDTARRLGHGGCFVFLPVVERAPVRLKHPLAPVDLGAELVGVWQTDQAVRASVKRDTTDFQNAAAAKHQAVRWWLRRLRSVAHLSAADGCVVFDRHLVLHGYGGEIVAPEPTVGGRLHDLTHGRDADAADLLKPFGTRHKSAYALCRAVPRAIAVVISQDGDIRLLASDESRVYFASGLRP